MRRRSVSVGPGEMVFTVMPRPPSSRAAIELLGSDGRQGNHRIDGGIVHQDVQPRTDRFEQRINGRQIPLIRPHRNPAHLLGQLASPALALAITEHHPRPVRRQALYDRPSDPREPPVTNAVFPVEVTPSTLARISGWDCRNRCSPIALVVGQRVLRARSRTSPSVRALLAWWVRHMGVRSLVKAVPSVAP